MQCHGHLSVGLAPSIRDDLAYITESMVYGTRQQENPLFELVEAG
jgi:hypothetical protein